MLLLRLVGLLLVCCHLLFVCFACGSCLLTLLMNACYVLVGCLVVRLWLLCFTLTGCLSVVYYVFSFVVGFVYCLC